MSKQYKLLAGNGELVLSDIPGVLGGNSKGKIYGLLTCSAANRALLKGYASHRVFFASELDAVKAGYRPCGSSMRQQYNAWKKCSEA